MNGVALTKVFSTGINDLSLMMFFMLIGVVILQVVKPLQKFYLPAGLVGGTVALILGSQVLNIIKIPKTWNGLPGPMINIVLACAIFGVTVNQEKLKNYAAAVNLKILTYFAQMFVGVTLGIALRKIWPNLPYSWGLLTVYTYWGGHGAGTAAGTVFESLGVPNMASLAIVMATLGLVVAMVVGIPIVNYGIRKGWATNLVKDKAVGFEDSIYIPKEHQKPLGFATVSSETISGLGMQLALVMFAMLLGKWIFGGLAMLPIPGAAKFIKMIPALVYGIIGAAIIWSVMVKTKTEGYADIKAIKTISGVALDVCVLAATATLNLKLFATYVAPLMIHMVVIVAMMIFICVKLLHRWMKHDWFELCVMAFGQGTGSSPSGYALARCVDADYKSASWEGFGVASGVFTPFTSMLAALMPMVAMQSEIAPAFIGLGVTIVCVLVFEKVIMKKA